MNDFLQWLSGSAITILALVLTFYIFRNALAWSSKSPKDVVFIVVSIMLVFLAARFIIVPAIDELYVGIREEVAQSQVAADLVGLAGVPQTVGVGPTQPVAQQGVPTITIVEQILTQVPEPTATPERTFPSEFFIFPQIDGLILIGDKLSIENPSGIIETFNASEITNIAACGWFLEKVDNAGNPTHLLACPPDELRVFSVAQVQLPEDFPEPPPIPTPEPTVVPVPTMSPDTTGACWKNWAENEAKLPTLTDESDLYPQFLPLGTTWTITGPSGLERLATAANELWLLENTEYSISITVNRYVGMGLGGQPNGTATVLGTGDWPPDCNPAQ